MSYRMILNLNNGKKVESPIIKPNNPKYNNNHKSIISVIENTGFTMIKYRLINNFSIKKE